MTDAALLDLPPCWRQLYQSALSGLVKEVNKLLINNMPACYAVEGYARGGFVCHVNNLNRYGFFNYQATYGYALGGHIEHVNERIAAGGQMAAAVAGYKSAGFLNDREKVLQLLASTHSPSLRSVLADAASLNFNFPDRAQELARAGAVNSMMRTYELDYVEAQKMMTLKPDERTWLLQGWRAFDGEMPFFVFLEMSAALLKCSTVSALKLFIALNKEIYARGSYQVIRDFQSGLFGIQTCASKQETLAENYKKRTREQDEIFNYQQKRKK